ncbi:hybrid sensor histidine kinase/response regulator transcription factor [Zunongwangia sp. HRR-M8]|uniref:hybrid sensor histidine kinase/response regulator transcription factor n=1 Tax=Zunongwangia sp. HRR-M8 TaxID=3015170 RepID=UPI0022DD342A|nr:hybrid sensor histidine kinase/response regulator transcription factor [Zunongwangia sp. HRR-M8]WBL23121.1 ATP-binding protein [Zunongwangia sp. HRR-M8]
MSQSGNVLDALDSRYRFSHKGVIDGLSPGVVNDFYKENKGFLWIATTSGLNRYDGYEFDLYSPKTSNASAIQSRHFRRVFSGPLGNIWCKTPEGINIFDPVSESFTADQTEILNKLGVSGKPIRDIVEIEGDIFLFIHEENEITRYDRNSKKVFVSDEYNSLLKKKDLEISSLVTQGDGSIFIIFKNGLIHQLNSEKLSLIAEFDQLQKKFNNTYHDFRMISDGKGDLWIHLFEDYGVFYFKYREAKLFNFTKDSGQIQLSTNLVSDIEKDAEGNIWIGSDLGGINVINPKELSVKYIKNNPEIGNSLSQNSITSLYCDDKGIMWVGTFKNGIDYYHPNIIRFPLQKKILSDPESLPFNDVNVFAEDKAGNLFIGTNGGGLIELNKKTGKYIQYQNNPDDPTSISSDVVVSMLYDSKDRLWIGTYLGGLNLMTKNGFKHFRSNSKDSTTIAGDNIWELFEDSNGKLWIGTLTGGVDVYDEERNRFIHSYDSGGKYPIHANYISSIAEDQYGQIWIGTSNGVDVINKEKGTVNHLTHRPDDKSSLSDNNILAIYKDDDNHIWVGSQQGLNLYNHQEKVFYHYGKQDGLPGEKIIGIVEDNEKDLWITSSFGIAQLKKGNRDSLKSKIDSNFKIYNDLDGLQGNLFNENSIFKNSEGEILVGGLHGYNVFKPQEFKYNQEQPEIIFTKFNLFNQEIKAGEIVKKRTILEKPLHETEAITLKHNQNFFSIEFAALDFFQPSKNNYRYKLIGVDNGWQNLRSSQRTASYTNIDPGEYTFVVQASNNDQVWNREGKQLRITILPPFYKTIYAYILYVVFILSLLYFARRRIIKKQQRSFEIRQEKQEADHLHKMDLMKIRFFTNISHEFKTPLSMILSPISKLKEQQHLGTHVKEQIDTINDNAQRLLNLINQILDLGNVKNDTLLNSSKANIVEFIDDIVTDFREYAENRGIKLNFHSKQKTFYTVFDLDKLDKIIYNLLSNAVKFTPKGGKISVHLDVQGSLSNSPKENKKWVIIEVEDTGVGIAEKDQEHIFDRFYKANLKTDINKTGSGIGLALVKEYVKLYNGKISCVSEPGKGTSFTIKLPLQDIPEKEMSNIFQKNTNKIIGQDDNLPTVLIIDDSREFLNYLGQELKEQYNIFIATDAETGWKKTLSIIPDLIVCDWEMPGMKGTDLCLKIRNDSRTKHIPFILLSGNQNEDYKLVGLKAGANDYVTKPFKVEVLKSRIENLIQQRKSFQEAYRKKIELPDVVNRVQVESEDEKLMRKVLQLVKKKYQDPDFTVKQLASGIGVSRSFLYNKSMSLFEKSPLELITDIRLEKGKELLKHSQLTISEIAFQTGFNNPKYFTKNFKKKYKMLPSVYKKQHS